MSDPYIGEIKIFPYDFAPYGFLACRGQILSVVQYQALAALLGATYGGDGRTNFGLPNLGGQAPVGLGVAPNGGTYNWVLGATHGQETVALVASQYPPHNHTISQPVGAAAAANTYVPQAGACLTTTVPPQYFAAPATAANTTTHPKTLGAYNGDSAVQPHSNCQPFLVLTPCIATMGVFPIFD